MGLHMQINADEVTRPSHHLIVSLGDSEVDKSMTVDSGES